MTAPQVVALFMVYLMIGAWSLFFTHGYADDEWGMAARAVLWPLFLVKAAIKTLRAGWRELLK